MSPFAQIALLLHVPFCVVLFATLPRERALGLALLSGILFLPERVAFDPPLLPPLDKFSLPALVCVGALASLKKEKVPASKLFWFWLVLTFVGQAGVVATNPDPVRIGPGIFLPGLTLWDFISSFGLLILNVGIPFELARRVFRSSDRVVELLRQLVAFGFVYALLMLVEMRMSPQLHAWVYGFHQHDFSQSVRGEGYRPMVFMAHGLATAMFCLSTVLAAVLLVRLKELVFGAPPRPLAWFLGIILFLARSMGAAIYGLFAIPLLGKGRPVTAVRVAALLGTCVISVPLLRLFGWFPDDLMLGWAMDLNPERAESLAFRFNNEKILFARWAERPWFGWGGYSRSHVFNSWGKDISVTDGHWIIVLGAEGVIGFVAQFSLLIRPLWLAKKKFSRVADERSRLLLAGLSILLALFTLDLVPNGLFNTLPVLFAGVLTGLVEGLDDEASTAGHSPRSAPSVGAPSGVDLAAPNLPRPPALPRLG